MITTDCVLMIKATTAEDEEGMPQDSVEEEEEDRHQRGGNLLHDIHLTWGSCAAS